MRKALIVGATSAIAQAFCRRLADRGARLYLVSRRADALETLRADVEIRGAERAVAEAFDVSRVDGHAALLERASEALGGLDLVLVAHGSLSDQGRCQASVEETLQQLHVNALSVIALLTLVANRFEAQKAGTIAVISSVAGDRGRASNYVYGTAKAAVTAFASGLRQRLHRAGVQVLTVKPGFVDTPMTAAFEKGFLWAKPDRVAAGIHRAVDRRKDVVYLPWFWRPILLVIRLVPERVFKRVAL